MNHPAKADFKARNLILDYALGATIVTLLPIPNIGGWQAIALVLLNILLVIGIARLWQFHKGGNLLVGIGVLFGIAGAILMGFLVWLLMMAVGVVVPLMGALAPGMFAFCYFWGMGQAVNHFYMSQLPFPPGRSPSGEQNEI
ncbi:MAG: hypothetical protein HY785_17030 [Oscillatoriophycideae cyanobacterium NC_groundwater_1537_Pr4_S-0.65um_50_18]|nr:hypothetical protein [Oscillatoriophycideae cyanobacterium NC_groundwater_1537_Pr4_S-0.65um_50_18]